MCLSRACLGKMYVFKCKWRAERRLKAFPFVLDAHLCLKTRMICQDRLGTNQTNTKENVTERRKRKKRTALPMSPRLRIPLVFLSAFPMFVPSLSW
eukprot:COSAG06_NODE_4988_length_3804_cov_2162.275574_4_plen_96_part_00